jgi:hypothetical protein
MMRESTPMNRNTGLIGIALAAVAALQLPLNADASCGTGVSFDGYYSLIVGTSNGPSLRANFWVLDEGDPTVGAGVDNGNVADNSWIRDGTDLGGPWVVMGDWMPNGDNVDYDGCPNNLPNGGATSSMVFSLSDLDGAGNMTYAVICTTRNTQTYMQYSTDFPPGCDANSCVPRLAMVPAPQATITNSVRTLNDVTVTVASPNFAAGFYGDGSPNCTAANAIPQYDVYEQQTARGVPPSPWNDAGPWVLAATCDIGSPCTLPAFISPTNTDIVPAVSPHFDSDFTTGEAATGAAARVGVKSTQLQAGPTLAVTPKPKTGPDRRRAAPRPQGRQ